MDLRSKIRAISYLRDLYVLRCQQPISQNYFPRSSSEMCHNMSGRIFWTYLRSLVTVLWIEVRQRGAGSNCVCILPACKKAPFVLPFQQFCELAAESLTVDSRWSSLPSPWSAWRQLQASCLRRSTNDLKKMAVRNIRLSELANLASSRSSSI